MNNNNKYQEIIIDYLKKNQNGADLYTIYKLCNAHDIYEGKERKLIEKTINFLISNGSIIVENDTFFVHEKSTKILSGTLKYENDKYLIKNNGIIIEVKNDNNALEGDIVEYKISEKINKNYYKGKIKKILRRNNPINVVCVENDGKLSLMTCTKMPITLDINNINNFVLVPGEIYSANISNNGSVDLMKRIGNMHDPDIDIKRIAAKHNIFFGHSEEAMEQAYGLPTHVREKDLKGRRDIRDRKVFTIDDITAKDYDDAISIYINEKGNYVLCGHLIDVPYYIKIGTPLFKEIIEKGNSRYFGSVVDPMLPFVLCNGICSINPNEDRLVFTREIEYNKKGDIISEQSYLDVINSKKRMTYSDVDKLFINNEIVPGYEPFVDDLLLMKKLSDILDTKFNARGGIDFNNEEPQFETDSSGNPFNFKSLTMTPSRNLIKNFMLEFGESIAFELSAAGIPIPYRIHEEPDRVKLEELCLMTNGKVKMPRDLSNRQQVKNFYQTLLNSNSDPLFVNEVIKRLKRAKQSTNNIGHFCLAYDLYAQLTSPARRAGDYFLIMLAEKYMENPIISDVEELKENLEKICINISTCEENSEKAEREINEYECIKYFNNNSNNLFPAEVITFTPEYITVKVDGFYYSKIPLNHFFNKKFELSKDQKTINYRNEVINIGNYIAVRPCEIYLQDSHVSFRFNKVLENEKSKSLILR